MAKQLGTTEQGKIEAASVGAELFNDVLDSAPLVFELKNRKIINGTVYKGLRRTANPAGGWRTINHGVSADSASYDNVTVDLKLFDQPMIIDKAFAKAVNGTNAMEDVLVEESKANAEALLNGIDYAAFNAVSGAMAGLQNLAGAIYTCDTGAFSAISATNTSRAYFVKTPELEIVFGNNDVLTVGEWNEQIVYDGDSKPYKAYVNAIETWVALNPKSSKTVAAVVNITEAAPFTDAVVSNVVANNKGKPFDVCFLSRKALKQLQDSRATALSGSSAAIQGEMASQSYGIRLVVSDNISNAYPALSGSW